MKKIITNKKKKKKKKLWFTNTFAEFFFFARRLKWNRMLVNWRRKIVKISFTGKVNDIDESVRFFFSRTQKLCTYRCSIENDEKRNTKCDVWIACVVKMPAHNFGGYTIYVKMGLDISYKRVRTSHLDICNMYKPSTLCWFFFCSLWHGKQRELNTFVKSMTCYCVGSRLSLFGFWFFFLHLKSIFYESAFE